MRPADRDQVLRWAGAFGWQAKGTAKYGIFKRETHYIVVAWDDVPPGYNIAHRVTDPAQPEAEYATSLGRICGWLTEPQIKRSDPLGVGRPPAPAPAPPEPTPSEQFNARSVARFKEMEF